MGGSVRQLSEFGDRSSEIGDGGIGASVAGASVRQCVGASVGGTSVRRWAANIQAAYSARNRNPTRNLHRNPRLPMAGDWIASAI